jgi:hypothetical protein
MEPIPRERRRELVEALQLTPELRIHRKGREAQRLLRLEGSRPCGLGRRCPAGGCERLGAAFITATIAAAAGASLVVVVISRHSLE